MTWGDLTNPIHEDLFLSEGKSTLFEWLNRRWQAVKPGESPNFEQLIFLLETLGTYFPIGKSDRPHRQPLEAFIKSKYKRWNNNYYGMAARMYSEEALRLVAEDCLRARSECLPLTRLVSQLSADFDLWIYSLNYDDVPEQAGVQLFNGFNAQGRLDGAKCHREVIGHRHIQLHGSVLWEYDNGYRRHQSLEDANIARGRHRTFGGRKSSDGNRLEAIPLITGGRKSEKILLDPFATFHHMFRRDLMNADGWLVAGYGFADFHINEVLKSAHAARTQGGSTPNVAVVDFLDFRNGTGGFHEIAHFDSFSQRPPDDQVYPLACGAILNRIFEPWHFGYQEFRRTKLLDRSGAFRGKLNEVDSQTAYSLDGLEYVANHLIHELSQHLEREPS